MVNYKALQINRSVNHPQVQSALTPRMYRLGKELFNNISFSNCSSEKTANSDGKKQISKRTKYKSVEHLAKTEVKREEKGMHFTMYIYLFPSFTFLRKGDRKNISQVTLAFDYRFFSPITFDRFTRPYGMLKLHFPYSALRKSWPVYKRHAKQVI